MVDLDAREIHLPGRYNITSTEDLHAAANRVQAGSKVLDVKALGSNRPALLPAARHTRKKVTA